MATYYDKAGIAVVNGQTLYGTPNAMVPGSDVMTPAGLSPTNATSTGGSSGASTPTSNSSSGAGLNVQSPGWNGTGQFVASPYPINDTAITGAPTNGDGNYGLNDVYNNLSSYVAQTTPQNYSITAPQTTAAQGTAAYGQATTGTAAQYAAAQAAAQGYTAQDAAAQGYQAALAAAQGYTAQDGSASTYNAALGNASTYQAQNGTAQTYQAYQDPNATSYNASLAGQTGISTAGDAEQYAVQQGLEGQLQTTASGGGVSPADLQLQQGEQNQVAAQLAVLGSQRGGLNAGLAQYSAANQSANAMAQLNQNMGIQRAQETLAAQNALGNVASQARTESQNYNINQADLTQQVNLANQGALNAAGQYNATNLQNVNLTNAAAINNAQQFDTGALNTQTLANQSAQNQAAQYDTGALNTQALANQAASNNAMQYDAGALQSASFDNAQMNNAASQFTAGAYNTANLANAAATNNASAFTANAYNTADLANAAANNQASQFTANAYNTADLQNAAATNTANQYDTGALNTQTLANMQAINAQTNQNVGNAQQIGIANLGNAQQTDLANLSASTQVGLANQSTALNAQQQYYNQLLALAGAQTGIAQSNRSAALADQTLETQQRAALNNTNELAFNTSAMANSNFAGSIMSAAGGLTATMIQAFAKGIPGGMATLPNGQTVNYDANGNAINLPAPSSAGGGSSIGGGAPSSSLQGNTLPTPSAANGGQLDPAGTPISYGDGITDANGNPLSTEDQLLSSWNRGGTLSDLNAKTGVAGGNPMLASFLDQLSQSKDDQLSSAMPTAGTNPTYQKETVQVGAGGGTPDAGADAAGSAIKTGVEGGISAAATAGIGAAAGTAITPGIGTLVGAGVGLIAGFIGDLFGGGGSSSSPPPTVTKNVETSPGSSSQWAIGSGEDLDEEDTAASSLSDEKSKDKDEEDEMAASQSLDAFLAKAGAAQAQQGGVLPGGVQPGGVVGGGVTPGGFGSTPGNYGVVNPGGVTSMGGPPPPPAPMRPLPMTWPTVGTPVMNANLRAQLAGAQMRPDMAATPPPPVNASLLAQLQGAHAAGQQMAAPVARWPLAATQAPPVSPAFLAQLRAAQGYSAPPPPILSDETAKTAIDSDPAALQGFLDSIHAHQYRYKDPDQAGAGHGTFVSPMAQEIESTELGKNFVSTGSDGYKRVDYGKMAGTMLGAQAYLNERLRTLEKAVRR